MIDSFFGPTLSLILFIGWILISAHFAYEWGKVAKDDTESDRCRRYVRYCFIYTALLALSNLAWYVNGY